MMRHIQVEKEYNFESDVESHINGEDLSDLSDVFEDDNNPSGRAVTANKGDNSISLDEISYNRDVNMINVPTASKTKTVLLSKPGRRKVTEVYEEGFSKRKQPDNKREIKEKPARKERAKKDSRPFDRNADDDVTERKVANQEDYNGDHVDSEYARSDNIGKQRQKPLKRDKQQYHKNEDREIDELLDSQRPAIAPVLGDSPNHKSMPNAFPRNIAKGLSDIVLNDFDEHGSNEEANARLHSKGRKFDSNQQMHPSSDSSFRKSKGKFPPSATSQGHHQYEGHRPFLPRPPNNSEYPRGDPRIGRGSGRNGRGTGRGGTGRGRGRSGRMSGRDEITGRLYPSYINEDAEYYAQYFDGNGYDEYGGYYLEDGSYYPGGDYGYNYGHDEYGYGDYDQYENTYSYGQSEVSGYYQRNDSGGSQKPSFIKSDKKKSIDNLPREEEENLPQRIVTPAMVEADLAAVASLNPKAQEFVPNFSFR